MSLPRSSPRLIEPLVLAGADVRRRRGGPISRSMAIENLTEDERVALIGLRVGGNQERQSPPSGPCKSDLTMGKATRHRPRIISHMPRSGAARLDKRNSPMAPRARSTFPVALFLAASTLLAGMAAFPEIAAAQVAAVASGSSRPPAPPATEGSAEVNSSAPTVLRGSRPVPEPQVVSPDYAGGSYGYGYSPYDYGYSPYDYGYWPFGFDNGFSGRGRHRFARNRFARRPFPGRPNIRAHIGRGFAAAHFGGFGHIGGGFGHR